MNPKIHDIIESLTADELKTLDTDLREGHVQHLVGKRLESYERRQTMCPVCNNDPGESGFTLIFGPADFRKKATFCGQDCLEYFLGKLKEFRQPQDHNEPATGPQSHDRGENHVAH